MIYNLLNFTTNLITSTPESRIQYLEIGIIVLGVLFFIVLAGLIAFIILLEKQNNKLTKLLEQHESKRLTEDKTKNSKDDGI